MTARRRLLVAALAALAAWLGTASFLFLWPRQDEPGSADAVVVLAGHTERLPVGERLVRRGVAPVLALSYDEELHGPTRLHALCATAAPRRLCFEADPFSTRGEARAVARLAEARGWDEVVVVTSDFHVFRSRLLFERCLGSGVRVVGAPYERWRIPQALLTESVKLAYALTLGRGC